MQTLFNFAKFFYISVTNLFIKSFEIKRVDAPAMMSEKYIRIALLGDGGVGKTCLLNRYIKSEFKENMRLTIFLNCETKKVQFEKNTKSEEYVLYLYDFGGQERFRFMLDDVNRIKPDVVLLTFDLTDMQTFLNVEQYHNLISNGQEYKSEILLVGSKSDLERDVPEDQVKAFCEAKNIERYYEVSAKTGEKIESLFQNLVECYVNNRKNQHEPPLEDNWNSLTVTDRKKRYDDSYDSHWNS